MVMDNRSEIATFTRNWLIAASSVVIARTLTAPAERVKIILQTQGISPHFRKFGVEPYKDFCDVVIRIHQEHGFLGYWRGNGVNLVKQLPSSSFTFAFNDLFKAHIIGDSEDNLTFGSRLGRHMLCGALAGLATMTIMQPVALCQTLVTADLATDPSRREFSGTSGCIKSVYSKTGLFGFYTGYAFGVVGMSTYRSVYFGLFATCKHYFETYYGGRSSFMVLWPIAQVVTLLASATNYPFDTISRNQQITLLSRRPRYKGPFIVMKEIYHKQGLLGFYRGVMVNALRTIGSSLVIVGYDEIQYRFFTPEEKKLKSFVSMDQHEMEDTIRRSWETKNS